MRRWWLGAVLLVVGAVLGGAGCEKVDWARELAKNTQNPTGKLEPWSWRELDPGYKPQVQVQTQVVAWHPPLAQRGGRGPAPTVRRGPSKIVKGHKMSSWIVTGAGDSNYDGIYTESGTWYGQPAYTNGSHWLYLWGYANWALGVIKDDNPTFQGKYISAMGTLPSTWSVAGYPQGTSPAPTVSEYVPVTPGGFTWNWWEDGPFFPDALGITPGRVALAGGDYVVFPARCVFLDEHSFHCYLEADGTWSDAPTDSDFLTVSTVGQPVHADPFNSGGVFDCDDASHFALCSGFYWDGTDLLCDWTKFALIPGTSATPGTTETLILPAPDISNFVKVATDTYRFILINGATIQLCEYTGGTGYDVIATYATGTALPTGFTALPLVYGYASAPDRTDHALFAYDGTLYWMRRCVNGGRQNRVAAYVITDTTCTLLADVLDDRIGSDGTQPGDGNCQTWGYFADAAQVWGDLGQDSENNTTLRWVPGNNATQQASSVRFGTTRRWYLDGDPLLLAGWYDNHIGKFLPFVMPMTGDAAGVLPVASMQTTAYSPTMVDIDVLLAPEEGDATGTGTVDVHITQPVHLAPEEGDAIGTGTVHLIGATHIEPGEGDAGGTGTVELAHGLRSSDGRGDYAQVKLTPGVWPGLGRREARPGYFARQQNRIYGGRLANGRPAWRTPLDNSNPLAQYVSFWSFCAVSPDGYISERGGIDNGITPDARNRNPNKPLIDASPNRTDGWTYHCNDDFGLTVVWDYDGYDGNYRQTALRSLVWLSEDGLRCVKVLKHGAPAYEYWYLGPVDGTSLDDAVATSPVGTDRDFQPIYLPWQQETFDSSIEGYADPVIVINTDDRLSIWNNEGVYVSRGGAEWDYAGNPAYLYTCGIYIADFPCPVSDPCTFVFDFDAVAFSQLFYAQEQGEAPSVSPWYWGYVFIIEAFMYDNVFKIRVSPTCFNDDGFYLNVPQYEFSAEPSAVNLGDATRVVASWEAQGNGLAVWVNGVALSGPEFIGGFPEFTGVFLEHIPWQAYRPEDGNPFPYGFIGGVCDSGISVPPYWPWPEAFVSPAIKLSSTLHEVGLLGGYAATAEDVATNPGLALPYGFAGAPTALTDQS